MTTITMVTTSFPVYTLFHNAYQHIMLINIYHVYVRVCVCVEGGGACCTGVHESALIADIVGIATSLTIPRLRLV